MNSTHAYLYEELAAGDRTLDAAGPATGVVRRNYSSSAMCSNLPLQMVAPVVNCSHGRRSSAVVSGHSPRGGGSQSPRPRGMRLPSTPRTPSVTFTVEKEERESRNRPPGQAAFELEELINAGRWLDLRRLATQDIENEMTDAICPVARGGRVEGCAAFALRRQAPDDIVLSLLAAGSSQDGLWELLLTPPAHPAYPFDSARHPQYSVASALHTFGHVPFVAGQHASRAAARNMTRVPVAIALLQKGSDAAEIEAARVAAAVGSGCTELVCRCVREYESAVAWTVVRRFHSLPAGCDNAVCDFLFHKATAMRHGG